MITVIAEHTIDISLLPPKARILDLGCRNFQFTNECRRLGYIVYPIDCDTFDGTYYRLAITDYNGIASIVRSNDPQAVRVEKNRKLAKLPSDIKCMTLTSFSKSVQVRWWDAIKVDIEGAEYEMIMSLNEPPTKMLSIEFHLHTGIYGDAQVKEMEDKLLSLGYFPVKHDKYPAHGLSPNYWDSLWILK